MKFRAFAALFLALPVCARFSQAQPVAAPPQGVIRQIEFYGLHRIPPATLSAQISSREGQVLDPARVERDVRGLDRLGWFDSVTAEAHPLLPPSAEPLSGDFEESPDLRERSLLPTESNLRLVFVLEERLVLAEVEFSGSRVLSQQRITTLLESKGIKLKIAAPVNRAELWRAERALEGELAELGHPFAEVRLRLEQVPTWAVRATFQIHDGPRIEVSRVTFSGNRAFSDEALRRQMKRIAPGALFAGMRGKTIYTPERLTEDLERLANFYRNRGYAEARLGTPRVETVQQSGSRSTFAISIPVEEGLFYQLEAVELSGATPHARAGLAPLLRGLKPPAPYSQEKLMRLAEELARLSAREAAGGRGLRPDVEVIPHFDRLAGTARVTLLLRETEPYTIRRIEFLGHRRFSDRYYRRRILLQEGEPFDPEKLERGLAQLARTGFIRSVESEDVRVQLDETHRTADVTIRFREIGRRRFSLVGGGSGPVNSLGIVYEVFDLLGREELLTTHLEGGPESLKLLLGLGKEGVFGTNASFGISLFHNVIRPRLPGVAGRQRLFTSRSSGLALGGNYPVTSRDSLGVNYELSRTSTQLHLPPLQEASGASGDALRLGESRRAVALSWLRYDGHQRLDAAASISGGPLGGDEKLLRSSLEYSRIQSDPLSGGRNAWALRGYLAGVSGYGASPLPLHKRLFGSEELLRGFRAGEVAPYAVVETVSADGTPALRAQSAGGNLVGAFNGEYRVPLDRRTEAAGFLDAGTGWLLPQWLGAAKPNLVGGTNGLLRASTGVELRFRMPVVNETLRLHYAVNPLRLARAIVLPDGNVFRPPDRRAVFGWALGSLF